MLFLTFSIAVIHEAPTNELSVPSENIPTEKGLSPTPPPPQKKHAKSITFTFVSQFDANFEIKFLLVYSNHWSTLIFQKEIYLPENQIITANTICIITFTYLLVCGYIAKFHIRS